MNQRFSIEIYERGIILCCVFSDDLLGIPDNHATLTPRAKEHRQIVGAVACHHCPLLREAEVLSDPCGRRSFPCENAEP